MNTPITFHSLALAGLNVHPVTVRAELVTGSGRGDPLTVDVRSPSTDFSSLDARALASRVMTALDESIRRDPSQRVRVTVECAVAPNPTTDLAVACAVVHALGLVDLASLGKRALFAELSPAGKLRAPRGLACAIRHMRATDPSRPLVTADEALAEAKALGVPGVTVLGFANLADILDSRPAIDAAWLPPMGAAKAERGGDTLARLPSGAIARVLMAAAAGEHGVFFAAEHRSAPTSYARALAVVMPTMTDAERLDVACARSTHGTEYSIDPAEGRPFRAPHHTVSQVMLEGRGDPLSVGELALAHHGVFMMADAHAWTVGALATIRDAHRSSFVHARGVQIPARFVLVGVSTPCPCGAPLPGPCGCAVSARDEHTKKSGPVRRLCDIVLRLPAARARHDAAFTITDAEARRIVTAARERAIARQGVPNGRLPDDSPFLAPVLAAIDAAHLGIETPDRAAVARLARTIADLDGRDDGEPWESWDVMLAEDVAILRSGVPTR